MAVLSAGIVIVAAQTAAAYRRSVALYGGLRSSGEILAVLASRSARVVSLQGRRGARVRLVYDPARRRGILVVVRLGEPGAGRVYRVWLTDGGPPQPVAAFVPAPGLVTLVPVRADFSRARTVAVDAGPAARAAREGTPLVQASLASSIQRVRPPRPSAPLPRR